MKTFIKFLSLAQAASSGGKGRVYYDQHNKKAVMAGYSLKEAYIKQAIAAARKLNNVTVSQGWENVEYYGLMSIIYFDIKNVGQVSFHTFLGRINGLKKGRWNGIFGESQYVINRLNRKYKLNYA